MYINLSAIVLSLYIPASEVSLTLLTVLICIWQNNGVEFKLREGKEGSYVSLKYNNILSTNNTKKVVFTLKRTVNSKWI